MRSTLRAWSVSEIDHTRGRPALGSLKGGIPEYRSREILAGAGDKLTGRKTQIQVMLILSTYLFRWWHNSRVSASVVPFLRLIEKSALSFKTEFWRGPASRVAK